jgi:hypothetical protein
MTFKVLFFIYNPFAFVKLLLLCIILNLLLCSYYLLLELYHVYFEDSASH